MAEITLLTYWKVVQKRKRVLLAIMMLSASVAAFTTLLQPREYTAHVTTFPPAGSVNVFPGLGIVSPAIGGNPTSVDSLSYLIKSRRMAESVAGHFNLAEKFKMTQEGAIRKVPSMVNSYDVSRGTLFVVEATTNDPKFSADLANFCAESLNLINAQLDLTTDKPMVKVIDAALPPEGPNSRGTLKKILSAILFSGVSAYFFFFMLE